MMNIGVIGAGWWGKNIIKTLENIQDVVRVYVYDIDKDVTTRFKDLKKPIFVDSIEAIESNKNVKALCIATPPKTHYELSKKFLCARKHVIVEKPPALKLDELEELSDIAGKNKLVYMLDALFLFLEPIKKLKYILNSNELNNIKLIQMYRIGDELRREGAGLKRINQTMFSNKVSVIDDLLFHDAGILLYLFNDIVVQNVKKYHLYHGKYCDSVVINFLTKNIPIELILSWTFSGRRRGITIYNKEFIIEYNGLAERNQVSKFNLNTNKYTYYNFEIKPPLTNMLDFYIKNIEENNTNHFLNGHFMIKLFNIWDRVK